MRLPIQVQAILFRQVNGEIQYLLLKRISDRGEFWQPVTGGVEAGETRIQALHREVLEETGIKHVVRIIEDVGHYEFWVFFQPEARSRLIQEYVFGVEISSNKKITIGREHSDYRWCSLEEGLKLLKWNENKEALKNLNEILSVLNKF
jgi:dATP pyrophosphohydrolase